MVIEFDFPNDQLEVLVKDAVVKTVATMVRNSVDRQTIRYHGLVENAVEEYLSKRLTDTEIKGLIDKAIIEKIRELVGND